FPHITVPKFMFGFYDYMSADVAYRDPVFPRLEVDYRNDLGLIAGTAFSYKDYFSAGFSIRWIRRYQISEDMDTATVLHADTSYLESLMRKGDGWGLNIGFQTKRPLNKSNWIAAGFAVEDVGYTTFRSADRSVPLPERQPMRMNVGLAWGLAMPVSELAVFFD